LTPAAGLLDTSVLIANEEGRATGKLPTRVALGGDDRRASQGVLNAVDDGARAQRADTLALARAADPIPISEAIMVSWACLVADCRAACIHHSVRLTDSLIAATAIEHGLYVVTQDRDYEKLASAHPDLQVLRV
jgi:predicted nucleic acid-binding protein